VTYGLAMDGSASQMTSHLICNKDHEHAEDPIQAP
jgi:hypothetical protein